MDLTREAIDKIESLANQAAAPVVIDGLTYLKGNLIRTPLPPTLRISTLTGLASYLTVDNPSITVRVNILSPGKVLALSACVSKDGQRQVLAEVESDKSELRCDEFLPIDYFIIMLMANIVPSPARDALIAEVRRVDATGTISYEDDGVTQTATIKESVTRAGKNKFDPIQELAPYRTFPEIEQPTSPYLFRLRKGDKVGVEAALFESGDCTWKVKAIKGIEKFLGENGVTNLIF